MVRKKHDRTVGIGQIVVSTCPEILLIEGLGSCLAIVLHDAENHITAIAHTLLPDGESAKKVDFPGKYVDSAIEEMIHQIKLHGGNPAEQLQAKLAGGAHMFHFDSQVERLTIGDKNIKAAHQTLERLHVPLSGEDTGGDKGRTLLLDTVTGELMVLTIKGPEKTL